MKFITGVVALGALCLVRPALAQASRWSESRADDLESTLGEMQRAGAIAGSIAYQGTYKEHGKHPGTGVDGLTHETEYSILRDVVRGGRIRFAVKREMTPWVGGTTPFSESAYVCTFDGRIGQLMYTMRRGLGTNSTCKPYGDVYAKSPELTKWASVVSLWEYTIYGMGEGLENSTLAEIIGDAKRLGKCAYQWRETRPDERSIEFRIGDDAEGRTIVCDATRRFAITQGEQIKDGVVRHRVVVDEFKEVGPVVLPVHGKMTHYSGTGAEERQGEFWIRGHEYLPSVDASRYTLEWPEDSRIEDRVFGTIGTAGATDAVLEARIARLVNDVLVESKMSPLPSPASGPERGRPEPWKFASVAATALIMGAGAAFLIRKWRRRTTLLWLAVFAGLGHAQTTMFSEAKIPMKSCGLDTTLFVTRFFGRQLSAAEGGHRLGIGPFRERPATLLGIKSACEAEGLSVRAFESATPKNLPGLAQASSLVVVHTNGHKEGEPGHFYVVAGARDGGLLVVDPSRGVNWMKSEDFGARIGPRMSGAVLVVANAAPAQAEVDLSGSVFQLDFDIASGNGDVQLVVPVFNPGHDPMVIESGKGSCSCFLGATFAREPTTIRGNTHDELRFRFDGSRIDSGTTSQSVLLRMRGKTTENRLFKFSLNRPQEPKAAICQAIPQSVFLGEVPAASVSSADVVVVVSSGCFVRDWTVSTDRINVISLGEEVADSFSTARRFKFRVDCKTDGPKVISENVVFNLADARSPSLRIPIRGIVK